MKILVVDDEALPRTKLQRILKRFGQCDAVDSGQTAISDIKEAFANNSPYDLITLDVVMPDMDGTEVLFEVRALEKALNIQEESKVKILMVTGKSDKDTIITSIQAGCDDYIVKPLDAKKIIDKVAAYQKTAPPDAGAVKTVEESASGDQPKSERVSIGQEVLESFKRGEVNLASPSNPVWLDELENMADKMFEAGQYEEAVAQFEQVLDPIKKRSSSLNTEIGSILIEQGKYEEAIKHLETAVQDDAFSSRSWEFLGRAHMDSGGSHEAVKAFTQAYSMNPNNLDLQILLTESLITAGLDNQSESFMLKCLRQNPGNVNFYNRMAIMFRKKGFFSQAAKVYLKVLEISPDDENLLFNLGRCLFEAGSLEQAANVLKKTLKLRPDHEKASRLLTSISQRISLPNSNGI